MLYHPDKNKNEGADDKFKSVGAAYAFLSDEKNITKDTFPRNFQELVKKCLEFMKTENKWENIFINTTLQSILLNYKDIPLKVFENLNKDRALEVYDFLSVHKDIFSVTDKILKNMKNIIEKKMTKDNIFILNPHLEDMFDDTIYKLEIDKRVFYIPLWHNELCYDASGKDIIVQMYS